jgi:hypothetical protein
MAHFCQLDENNVVTQVIVVANSDTADASGVEKRASVRRSARNYLVAHGSRPATTATSARTMRGSATHTTPTLMLLFPATLCVLAT